jgi:hypothetical protein
VDEVSGKFSVLFAFPHCFLERKRFFMTQFDLVGETLVVVGHAALLQ